MLFLTHLKLLLWKNFTIQRRKVFVTLFEIVVPVVFAFLFFVIRYISDVEVHDYRPMSKFHVNIDLTKNENDMLILYSPNNTLINGLIPSMTEKLRNSVSTRQEPAQFKGFETDEDMEAYFHENDKRVHIGFVFNNVHMEDTELPKNLLLTIRPRTDPYDDWKVSDTFPILMVGIPEHIIHFKYRSSGFLFMMQIVHHSIVRHFNSSAETVLNKMDILMARMPYPPYIKDFLVPLLQLIFPLIIVLTFIMVSIQTTKSLVFEKEARLKETMKLMGVSSAAHWVSWYITAYFNVVIVMIVYTVLCCIDAGGNGSALKNTDPILFFAFLLCYGAASISFCFMISVFTQKANTGAALCGVLFFLTYCPYLYYAIKYSKMTRYSKLLVGLDFNVAMAFGAKVIALAEAEGKGVQWSTYRKPSVHDDNYTLYDTMVVLILDSIIYSVIMWYFDNIISGEHGIPRPINFMFTRSYWFGTVKRDYTPTNKHTENRKYFEKEPIGMNAGISIRDLRKVFHKGASKKVAVDNMNLNMYEGQIFVLLGHNGAGKSTTLSMLTGFLTSSGGTAIVNGYDVNNDIHLVRNSLGVCAQYNTLFDLLTVEEHLQFFAEMKGCPSKCVKEEAENILQEIGLLPKRKTLARHLSGGQKRKLCVGIALIGGSKVIIMDEPTSGMDPAARRQTWDILQKNRQGRTILLTTHFMDEADLLGDRIAIMSDGEVKCCGTSYFLKKLYGAGYHLIIVKDKSCNVSKVTAVVNSFVPMAGLESELTLELSYLLPEEYVDKLPALFTAIESKKSQLGISSFGTTATTMEEVFLKAGETVSADSYLSDESVLCMLPGENSIVGAQSVLAFNKGFVPYTGLRLELSRFRAMFIKKMLHSSRNRIMTLVQILLPVFFTILALLVSIIKGETDYNSSAPLDLSSFGRDTLVPFDVIDANSDQYNTTAVNQFVDSYSSLLEGTNAIGEVIDYSKVVLSDITLHRKNRREYIMVNYFLQRAEELGVETYNKKMVIGSKFGESVKHKFSSVAYFNWKPYHSPAISLSYMLNAILVFFTNEDYSVSFFNHPFIMKYTKKTTITPNQEYIIAFSVGMCLMFGMSFLTSSFVYFLIKERQIGAKHLQMVCGLGPFVFWMANFVWDYINYLFMTLLLLIVFFTVNSPAYVEDDNLQVVALLLMTYGLAVLPLMYLIQFIFRSPTGLVITIILNLVTGIGSLLTTFMLELVCRQDQAVMWDKIFMYIIPHYCLAKSVMNMQVNHVFKRYCVLAVYKQRCIIEPLFECCDTCDNKEFFCLNFVEDILDWKSPGLLSYITVMIVQGFVFMMMTLAIEYHIPQQIWYKLRPRDAESTIYERIGHDEEEDVAAERIRVNKLEPGNHDSDALILKNLYKKYTNFVAVKHISIGIPEKECFGLLGQNGAGKTTTFKMLTGDVMMTGGNFYLEHYNIKNHKLKVHENMGYCPQFDAIISQMTGREMLYMFARLKGVPEVDVPNVCQQLIVIVMLTKYADKRTSDYSCGNKRKLSVAMALVGDPTFILLDEPSTGMDPRARRQMWNILSRIRQCGRTLILTSHSMEECDALCTRIAIMVNGQFVCLGTPQHLKNKFGMGYTLITRMSIVQDPTGIHGDMTAADSAPLVEFVLQTFPNTIVFDDHQGYVHFQVPYEAVSLAQVFTVMEQSKKAYHVEDYSVHQTTLEQVFLSFVHKQLPPMRKPKKKHLCC